MKPRWGLVVIAANLVVLVALAFVYPHLMVSPGPLSRGHAELTADCFACHAALRGAASQRCVACHVPADIGLRSTRGAALPAKGLRGSFHQQLIEQDCMACHSDHVGPQLGKRSRKPFSHELLRADTRERCPICHHKPGDELHRGISASCTQCHGTNAWKPASFDHREKFELDRDHNAPCVTCHVASNFSRYTCYGCHEHTPAKVRKEHLEEGISNFENCIECHRNARDEPRRDGKSGDKRKRERD